MRWSKRSKELKMTYRIGSIYTTNTVQALILSTSMALLMLGMSFGLIYFSREWNNIKPWLPAIPMLLAVFFIICTVFFDGRGVGRVESLLLGGVFAIIAVFITTVIAGAISYIWSQPGELLKASGGPEWIISALAACMIISMIILNILASEPER